MTRKMLTLEQGSRALEVFGYDDGKVAVRITQRGLPAVGMALSAWERELLAEVLASTVPPLVPLEVRGIVPPPPA